MDNKVNNVRDQEFERVVARLDTMRDALAKLAESQAVLTQQFADDRAQRREFRSEIQPVIDWVRTQMTGGLSARVDSIEKDAKETKAETRQEFATVLQRIGALEDLVKYVSGVGTAVVVFWSLFGDSVRNAVIGIFSK